MPDWERAEEPLRADGAAEPGERAGIRKACRPRRHPIVADACRSVTGRPRPEIIRAVRTTAARAALTMVTVAALGTGCSAVLDQVAVATGAGPAVAAPAAASGDAASALAALPVKGRAPKTGYAREQFGPAWADVDRNGCDTRNDVLNRDLTGETFKPGTHDCVVLTGTLADPYTGKTIAFSRGQGTSEAVQIDHVVALSDAWQKGAQQLDAPTPEEPRQRPAEPAWRSTARPTRQGRRRRRHLAAAGKSFRCTYVARQVAVKAKYRLWVTQAEHDAISGVLAGCPGQPLPADSTLPAPKAVGRSRHGVLSGGRARRAGRRPAGRSAARPGRRPRAGAPASSGASCQSCGEHGVECAGAPASNASPSSASSSRWRACMARRCGSLIT